MSPVFVLDESASELSPSPVLKSVIEFVVEVPFWKSSNTNKEDREWMRNHADVHIKIFKDAVDRGKEKIKKSKPKKVSTKKDTSDGQIGSTQTLFEKEKQK